MGAYESTDMPTGNPHQTRKERLGEPLTEEQVVATPQFVNDYFALGTAPARKIVRTRSRSRRATRNSTS
jgi:hypothetical protein